MADLDILTPGDYPAIRAAIDIQFDSSSIPENIITLDINAFSAEEELKLRVTDWAAIKAAAADPYRHLRAAAVYLTAARLTPAAIRLTALSVQARDAQWNKIPFDVEDKVAELLAKAEEEIEAITGSDVSTPTMFTRAAGTRGR